MNIREYEQIKTAIEAMYVYNINGQYNVNINNVLAILCTHVDSEVENPIEVKPELKGQIQI